MSGSRRYVNLWSVSNDISNTAIVDAYINAQEWPGLPKNLVEPVPIKVSVRDYGIQKAKPQPPFQGRVFKRGRYSFLSNYNIIP